MFVQSTLSAAVPKYIGADPTDRYSALCRDIDVCGLHGVGNGDFRAEFWNWQWDRAPQPLDVTAIAEEIGGSRVAMIDGPQALAAKGSTLRVCERQSAAVGKTPDARPAITKPFAGFICSSIDLFEVLRRERIVISPAGFIGGVSEVYPGHIWNLLSAGLPLPRKSTEPGRRARRLILEALGVRGLPSLPSHDQNDACVAAMLAAAADGQLPGVSAKLIGAPLSVDRDDTLREGPMVLPVVTSAAADRIANALRQSRVSDGTALRVIETASEPLQVGAEHLLADFIAKAVNGDPHICTYGWAYRTLFKTSFKKFSMAYAQKTLQLARRTHPRELPGLGLVRLDTFIVSKKNGFPGDGYWSIAHHDREEWGRALGNGSILD